jgi:outer membrane protein TolC
LRATHANNYSFGIEVTLPLYNVRSEVDSADARVESAAGQYRGALVGAANLRSGSAEQCGEARDALQFATHSAISLARTCA